MPTERPFRVIALIAAFNEEDIIADVVGHLIAQGVKVYLLDHRSTDQTVRNAESYVGKGLLQIETFPAEGDSGSFVWEQILRRKEALAQELDADWFIHHDADEFRESPWEHLTLAQGIQAVDRFSYNAIDFQVFNFRPTHNTFQTGGDVRAAFPYYEPGESFNKRQIKCWKKQTTTVDLVSSGGHDAMFSDRRIFPVRFILRHYPIRGQRHGEQKVFHERRGRFVAAEREKGWHVQYDRFSEGDSFVRDANLLTAYDSQVVRLELMLHHRGVEALQLELEQSRRATQEMTLRYDATLAALERDRATLEQRQRELASLAGALEVKRLELAELAQRLDQLSAHNHQLSAHNHQLSAHNQRISAELTATSQQLLDARHHINALMSSASWRWMAPLRAVSRILRPER